MEPGEDFNFVLSTPLHHSENDHEKKSEKDVNSIESNSEKEIFDKSAKKISSGKQTSGTNNFSAVPNVKNDRKIVTKNSPKITISKDRDTRKKIENEQFSGTIMISEKEIFENKNIVTTLSPDPITGEEIDRNITILDNVLDTGIDGNKTENIPLSDNVTNKEISKISTKAVIPKKTSKLGIPKTTSKAVVIPKATSKTEIPKVSSKTIISKTTSKAEIPKVMSKAVMSKAIPKSQPKQRNGPSKVSLIYINEQDDLEEKSIDVSKIPVKKTQIKEVPKKTISKVASKLSKHSIVFSGNDFNKDSKSSSSSSDSSGSTPSTLVVNRKQIVDKQPIRGRSKVPKIPKMENIIDLKTTNITKSTLFASHSSNSSSGSTESSDSEEIFDQGVVDNSKINNFEKVDNHKKDESSSESLEKDHRKLSHVPVNYYFGLTKNDMDSNQRTINQSFSKNNIDDVKIEQMIYLPEVDFNPLLDFKSS